MVILGHEDAWDLEAMSSARLKTHTETRWVYLAFATLWTALLITVSGLKEYSWFLIGIGGLGTLHNIYIAAAVVKPEELNIHLRPHPVRSTVTGYQMDQSAKRDLRATDPGSSDEELDNSFLGENGGGTRGQRCDGGVDGAEETGTHSRRCTAHRLLPGRCQVRARATLLESREEVLEISVSGDEDAGTPKSGASTSISPKVSRQHRPWPLQKCRKDRTDERKSTDYTGHQNMAIVGLHS